MNEILICKNDNQIEVEVTYVNDYLWLNFNQIGALFVRDKSVISRHIKNIYKDNELSEKATVAKNATVQLEGNRKVSRKKQLMFSI
ncbi:death-on-curing protein [Winogradskyella forsetii]|uniref:death-on-curing protein n=1 Tax=Winogradskyella forsetii TaxID=2686077 RepID=UPI0015C154D1|nr:death-on-curing protein [Winogradskyella forsetii]